MLSDKLAIFMRDQCQVKANALFIYKQFLFQSENSSTNKNVYQYKVKEVNSK